MIICKRCNQEKEPAERAPHLCIECVRAEETRVSHYRQHNYNWLDVAKEAELEIWERQPGETDREYQVWLSYRDAYPGVRPSYRLVAETLGTTINVVKKVGMRWSFPMRIQAWAKHCDELTMRQRETEILEMNKTHITMASKLNEKIEKAIDMLDPTLMAPGDIQKLLKLSAELERKARLDQPVGTTLVLGDDNPDLKKTTVKTESIGEIVEILGKAGILQNVGVRQTVTTEVVVKE